MTLLQKKHKWLTKVIGCIPAGLPTQRNVGLVKKEQIENIKIGDKQEVSQQGI